MTNGGRTPFLLASASSLYVALAWLTWTMSQEPPGPAGERLESYGQASGMVGGDATTFQRIRRVGADFSVEYGFRNFNQDELSVAVRIPHKDVQAAADEFGFKDRDFTALDQWYKKAQDGAIARTKDLYYTGKVTADNQAALQAKLADIKRRNDSIRAALDITLADLAKEYRERRVKLYADSGFRYKDARTVEVNMPGLIRKNARRMAPVSLAFSGIVEGKEYGMEELVGAVTAMVQTSIRYEDPGLQAGEKTIGGVLPPPKAFTLGQGDCDTKTGVIGCILINWPNLRLVGLAIPGHYLMGVHRIPAKGEYFVEHEGLPYVMIESAGPAWLPPGTVGDLTENYLRSGRLFAIQPFKF
ncbi:MAG: hypothetical protein HY553_12560 [Elusimicrobia bacterium]|nr:hypothetical protein [Elusimicrobiota bacterium]